MGRGTTADVTLPRAGLTLTGVLAGVLALLAFGAVMIGPYALTPEQVVSALLGYGDQQAQIVVWNIRLPRVGAALLVGAALAAAGASYQALFRNPLVSPDILGVSAGAGLGAVAGIFLSLPVAAIQASAFVGGMAAVGVVTLVGAMVRHADRTLTLVLLGVVVGALAGAATSLLKVMADPYDQLPAITFWLLGSLASITTRDILPALPMVLIGLVPLALLRWRINVLSLGDDEARALGVEAGRTRFLVIAAATLITASVTALAGVVGWVGLVIPHIARMLVGPGFGRLLPASALIGAGYLLIVDTLARTIAAVEVPLGVLTAVIGAPFFVWLLARGRRGWS
ncbi:iron ABC transporter permease [uncultured Roseovarius sp.]|uniref:FecCD family ABC transporter permease n=1 Tax=uncultured Roseovarius sp. TaxID=293344 RepID=UPI0025CD8C87|nr:iron ABC transporter permease [uncultured Roseovarius sp.]